MNKVQLTGRISRDLELRKTSSNTSIIKVILAVDKGTKDENGNRLSDFIRVDVWGSSADYLNLYAQKGTLIGIVGRVSTNKYVNNEGKTIYETYITAENVEILNQPKGKFETSKEDNIKAENEYKTKINIDIPQDELPFY